MRNHEFIAFLEQEIGEKGRPLQPKQKLVTVVSELTSGQLELTEFTVSIPQDDNSVAVVKFFGVVKGGEHLGKVGVDLRVSRLAFGLVQLDILPVLGDMLAHLFLERAT